MSEDWAKKKKKTDIFTFLKSKTVQICFLKETHSTPEIEQNGQWITHMVSILVVEVVTVVVIA